MKRLFLFCAMLFSSISLFAQIENPVNWSYSSKSGSGDEAVLILTAKIDGGWHTYSQFIGDGGPVPTSFKFKPSKDYELIGKVVEKTTPHSGFDKTFNMNIASFEGQAVFEQKVKLKTPKTKISGTLEYMVCNDHQCLPPEEVEFSISVTADLSAFKAAPAPQQAENNSQKPEVVKTEEVKPEVASVNTDTAQVVAATAVVSDSSKTDTSSTAIIAPVVQKTEEGGKKSMWGILLQGFLFGFVALLMPCIFPMIPLTVSFFTKRSASRAEGIKKAVIYGISIIVIYLVLGLGITLLFGSSKLNELASDATFNLIFFAILVVFAASFFGAFELSLPSSWATKADEKADKGGLIGIFFMAMALALASFSCTGPLIGTLLVSAASKGELLGPFMGMLGFSASLAIPFTLFAIFPNWLSTLPKSGGWLNSVKVVLGFIELAFALKFLSNVDLAYHWGILDREVFLVLWIVIFAMLGFYLLGKLKFSHDSDVQFISVPRLFLAMLSLAFSIYMIPGLWGAPLKSISAFAPPMGTQDFDLTTLSAGTSAQPVHSVKKYGDVFHAPHGIDAFFDYEEGLAYAKKTGKPVMLDFTGHSCVNCRKMEANVWSDPEVLKRIKENYVLISLYVDDRTALPENEQYTSKFSGKQITTVGKKWSDLQATKYNTNSQPLYVLIDNNGNELVAPQGYNPDIANYVNFLDKGNTAFTAVAKK
ncbi:protein-disulfide reductase DsbD family protein [Solitalea koreensis]|uniref:Thiol:disulfide interchange protein DsbD n=1 Tax=Solitalea koreensis TaxID=543615 RepID=A0A521CLD5_9SPHI|nr:cytochrome c biogenesis protein CcdA [Solitalea koreensis]SMO60259.1 thiol:disulfide interchange protein DsbD [Solitalea koreensis]